VAAQVVSAGFFAICENTKWRRTTAFTFIASIIEVRRNFEEVRNAFIKGETE
jgi:hypothetical protein